MDDVSVWIAVSVAMRGLWTAKRYEAASSLHVRMELSSGRSPAPTNTEHRQLSGSIHVCGRCSVILYEPLSACVTVSTFCNLATAHTATPPLRRTCCRQAVMRGERQQYHHRPSVTCSEHVRRNEGPPRYPRPSISSFIHDRLLATSPLVRSPSLDFILSFTPLLLILLGRCRLIDSARDVGSTSQLQSVASAEC